MINFYVSFNFLKFTGDVVKWNKLVWLSYILYDFKEMIFRKDEIIEIVERWGVDRGSGEVGDGCIDGVGIVGLWDNFVRYCNGRCRKVSFC